MFNVVFVAVHFICERSSEKKKRFQDHLHDYVYFFQEIRLFNPPNRIGDSSEVWLVKDRVILMLYWRDKGKAFERVP